MFCLRAIDSLYSKYDVLLKVPLDDMFTNRYDVSYLLQGSMEIKIYIGQPTNWNMDCPTLSSEMFSRVLSTLAGVGHFSDLHDSNLGFILCTAQSSSGPGRCTQ